MKHEQGEQQLTFLALFFVFVSDACIYTTFELNQTAILASQFSAITNGKERERTIELMQSKYKLPNNQI